MLTSNIAGVFETPSHSVEQMAEEAHRRYAEIMKDVEVMIDDHSKDQVLISQWYTLSISEYLFYWKIDGHTSVDNDQEDWFLSRSPLIRRNWFPDNLVRERHGAFCSEDSIADRLLSGRQLVVSSSMKQLPCACWIRSRLVSWHSFWQISVAHQKVGLQGQSKLKLLVPSIGTFFTRLPLADAFRYQDKQRFISSRRFVPPSFNDIRLVLNTAQLLGVTSTGHLDLATFDGDVTLYVWLQNSSAIQAKEA